MKKKYIIKEPLNCSKLGCDFQKVLFESEKNLAGLKLAYKKLKELQKNYNDQLKIEIR
jgi:hypothetical protein